MQTFPDSDPDPNRSSRSFGKVNPDVNDIAAKFKAIVAQIMQYCSAASESDILALVEYAFTMAAGKRMRLWVSRRTEELRRAQVRTTEAEVLDQKCKSGKIPSEIKDSFALPPTAWGKCGFWVLAFFGLLIVFSEAPNLAWYLRFTTDSFGVALVYSFPVMSIPFAETALLHKKNLFSDRARHICILIQAILGLASACGYLIMCLHSADSPSTYGQNQTFLSQESIRMGLQLVTSLMCSGLFFQCAISLGHRQSSENPLHVAAKLEAELNRRAASTHYDEVSEINGNLEQLIALKEKELLSCQLKTSQVRTEKERHEQNLKKILNLNDEL